MAAGGGDGKAGSGGAVPAVAWQWKHRTGFKDYESSASNRIEAAYQKGRAYIRLKSGKKGAVPVEVFFRGRFQYDPVSENKRDVRRVGPDPIGQRLERRAKQLYYSVTENGSLRQQSFDEYKGQRTMELANMLFAVKHRKDEELKENTFCSNVVRSKWFFTLSMTVVLVNSMWIGVEFDVNTAPCNEDEYLFFVMKNLFCLFYFWEIVVRFFAYSRTVYAVKDAWFIFDLMLALFLAAETWVLPGVSFLQTGKSCSEETTRQGAVVTTLRMARMLKLTRITRLLRLFPQLMTMLKGMIRATQAALYSLVLLALLIYIFGVMFALGARSFGQDQASGELTAKFPSVAESMWVMLLDGTLMDGVSDTLGVLRRGSNFLTALFLLFVFASSFTVLNLLIGIVAEVVSETQSEEQAALEEFEMRQALNDMLECYDQDDDRTISGQEFDSLLMNPEMTRTLDEHGIDTKDLVALKGSLMQGTQESGPDSMTFEEFLQIALRLKGSKSVIVRDVVELRDYVRTCYHKVEGFNMPDQDEQYPGSESEDGASPAAASSRSLAEVASSMSLPGVEEASPHAETSRMDPPGGAQLPPTPPDPPHVPSPADPPAAPEAGAGGLPLPAFPGAAEPPAGGAPAAAPESGRPHGQHEGSPVDIKEIMGQLSGLIKEVQDLKGQVQELTGRSILVT